jgi:hypothetical protein
MDEKPEIKAQGNQWRLWLGYGITSVIIYLILQEFVLLADLWPLNDKRQWERFAFGFFMGMNTLPIYVLFQAPFLLIIPMIAGPLGVRLLKGLKGLLIFSVLGAVLNIWLASELP